MINAKWLAINLYLGYFPKAFIRFTRYSVGTDSNSYSIIPSHAVTNDFTFSEAFYDLEITNGQERIRLVEGKVKNTEQVTLINP